MNALARGAVVLATAAAFAFAPAVVTGPAAAEPTLAPLLRADTWLNGRATAADFRGKVVLVDVFTYGCINCQNVTPNLRRLHATQAGLVIVGIHTPETPEEHVRANVIDALRAQHVTWPVAIDNGEALWSVYGVEYWPTELIFDKRGRLRKTVVGDSQDDLVDATVRSLVAED